MDLLSFDNDYTLFKRICFQGLCAGQYLIVIMIVDSTYDLVYGNLRVKRIQKMLEEYIAQDVKVETEVYCLQVGCSNKIGKWRHRTVPGLESA